MAASRPLTEPTLYEQICGVHAKRLRTETAGVTMRKYFLSSLGAAVAVTAYFLLLDFVRPTLEEHHSVPVWWAILGLYVIFVGGGGFWYVGRDRPGFAAIGFLLISAALYLYDPTINSHLESVGLKWVWIIPLAGYFLWLMVWTKTRPRSQNTGQ